MRSSTKPFAGDGGDQGGTGEDPTHPKSLSGDAIVSAPDREEGDMIAQFEKESASNWHEREGLGMEGPDVRVDGEVDFGDDVMAEEEPVVESVAAPPRWRLLRRYVNSCRPNLDDMTDHFNNVWKMRSGLNIARIKNSWYAVTFSEGDYNFIARGGLSVY